MAHLLVCVSLLMAIVEWKRLEEDVRRYRHLMCTTVCDADIGLCEIFLNLWLTGIATSGAVR